MSAVSTLSLHTFYLHLQPTHSYTFLLAAIIPPWTDDQRMLYLRTTARQMLDSGLTSVHDASLSLEDIAFLKRVDQEGRLPVRIYGMVSCEPLNRYCGEELQRYDGDRFVLRWVGNEDGRKGIELTGERTGLSRSLPTVPWDLGARLCMSLTQVRLFRFPLFL
jgi:hypothetical protein